MARGATPSVVRAVFSDPPGGETADCPLCGAQLTFTTHDGRVFERCPTRTCNNSIPHRPRPDLSMSRPTKKRRPRPY